MKTHDCLYSPRHKICRRVAGDGKVDSECELKDDSCRLKFVKLLGPVSASYVKFEKVNYYFFGDHHFGTRTDCDSICSSKSDCLDITSLLRRMFESKNTIDFYLETPFTQDRGESKREDKREDKGEKSKAGRGYIPILLRTFQENFDKNIYSNVKFHTIDTRYAIRSGEVLKLGIGSWVSRLLLQIFTLLVEEKDVKLEELEFLLLNQSLIPTMYNMILYSDDFEVDVMTLFGSLLKLVPESFKIETIHMLLQTGQVTRQYGKVQHRVRKQLHFLEKEGRKDLSVKIKNFTLDRIEKLYHDLFLSELWNEIINLKLDKASFVFSILRESIMSFVMLDACIVDAYTLARIFSANSDKRIIFIGDSHIQNYIAFFEQELKVKVTKFRSIGKRCTDIGVNIFDLNANG